jgi:hypothetical protein
MRSSNFYLLVLLASLGLASGLHAVLPSTMNYQGRIKLNSTNLPVPDGNGNTVAFNIYNVSSGGAALWTETWNSSTSCVTTTSGLFNVVLGTWNPISLPFDVPYWIEITWYNGASPETMAPRQPLTVSPYAFHAKIADATAFPVPLTLSGNVAFPGGVITTTNTGNGFGVVGYATVPGQGSGSYPDFTTPISAAIKGYTSVTNSAGVVGYSYITDNAGVGVLGLGFVGTTGFGRQDIAGSIGGQFASSAPGGIGLVVGPGNSVFQAEVSVTASASFGSAALFVSQSAAANGGVGIFAYNPASASAAIYAEESYPAAPGPSGNQGVGVMGKGSIGVAGINKFPYSYAVVGVVDGTGDTTSVGVSGMNSGQGTGVSASGVTGLAASTNSPFGTGVVAATNAGSTSLALHSMGGALFDPSGGPTSVTFNTDVFFNGPVHGIAGGGGVPDPLYLSSTAGATIEGDNFNVGYGVYGYSPQAVGVYGSSSNSVGVLGNSIGATAVYGIAYSGIGVYGLSTYGPGMFASSSSCCNPGLHAENDNFDAIQAYAGSSGGGNPDAVYGEDDSVGGGTGVHGFSSVGTGVYGQSNDITGAEAGVAGFNNGVSGTAVGVYGQSNILTGFGIGVEGDGGQFGVLGETTSVSGIGVEAENNFGGLALNVMGNAKFESGSTVDFTGATVVGFGGVAPPLQLSATLLGPVISGNNVGSGDGMDGSSAVNYGVYGSSGSGIGVGAISTSNYGLYANSNNSVGIFGSSTLADAIQAFSYGNSTDAIYGEFDGAGNGNGVEGYAATGSGVQGQSDDTSGSGAGVSGYNNAASGNPVGVYGQASNGSSGGIGVNGYGDLYGVEGTPGSTNAYAVFGSNWWTGNTAAAVYGFNAGNGNQGSGVLGVDNSPTGVGVQAQNSSSGLALNVLGNAQFQTGSTVNFTGATLVGLPAVSAPLNLSGSFSTQAVVSGFNFSTGDGVEGVSSGGPGVMASSGSGDGVEAISTNGVGVYGNSTNYDGMQGFTSGNSFDGIYGEGDGSSGNGVHGYSEFGTGVYGESQDTTGSEAGVYGFNTATSGNPVGVIGVAINSGQGTGIYAKGDMYAVRGDALAGTANVTAGVLGTYDGAPPSASLAHGAGVEGVNFDLNGYGVYGYAPNGVGVFAYGPSVATGLYAEGYNGIFAKTDVGTGSDVPAALSATTSNSSWGTGVYVKGFVGEAVDASDLGIFIGGGNAITGLDSTYQQSLNTPQYGLTAYGNSGWGVKGSTSANSSYGVYGENTGAANLGYGVYGTNNSSSGFGVYGVDNSGVGVYGTGFTGVEGASTTGSNNVGVLGLISGSGAPSGMNAGAGVAGVDSSLNGIGVYGATANGGPAPAGGAGVYGFTASGGAAGVQGSSGAGGGNPIGVLGVVNFAGAPFGGAGGVKASNLATSATGFPAIALDLDGGISFNGSRTDPVAGLMTMNLSSTGTFSAAFSNGLSNNQITPTSLIFLTPVNSSYPASVAISAYVTSVSNGSATIRVVALDGTGGAPGGGTVKLQYLILNPR